MNFRAMLDSPLLTLNAGCLKGIFYPWMGHKYLFFRAHMQPPGGVDTRRETRIICYLAAVILAILVLVAVIVVLTMMVAHHEMDFTNF